MGVTKKPAKKKAADAQKQQPQKAASKKATPAKAPPKTDAVNHIKDLKFDKRNARKHNARNIGMIEKSLQTVGAARSIVIDENNNILAGNGTVEGAAQAGITKVQVVEADGNTIIAVRRKGLTEKQKVELALYDNRTAELADWDGIVVNELLDEFDIKMDLPVEKFAYEEEGEDRDSDWTDLAYNSEVLGLKTTAIFESKNKFGIPDLDPEMIYDISDETVETWCSQTQFDPAKKYVVLHHNTGTTGLDKRNAIICFYVRDTLFDNLLGRIDEFTFDALKRKYASLITPNYSIFEHDPWIARCYLTYQTRWVGRYWQKAGIKIIPDIEFAPIMGDIEHVLAGLPINMPTVAIQQQQRFSNPAQAETHIKMLQIILDELKPKNVLCYTNKRDAILAKIKGHNLVFINTISNQIKQEKRR